jgi:dimethylargininase
LFTHAIVRPPARNFAEGITTGLLGAPCFQKASAQHSRYCEALRECGLTVMTLEPDPDHPDSTFVEDAAVLTTYGAILTRPGAPSRAGEVAAIAPAIREFFADPFAIEPPGTLDGGDICETEGCFLIGISGRTNEEGARQFAALVRGFGCEASAIDIGEIPSALHLKSAISYIGDNTMVLTEEMTREPVFAFFRDYEIVEVHPEESYAANCVRVNDRVLVPSGFPRLPDELMRRGFKPLPLEMSEFQKMDGGLSCLSLRF